MEPTYTLTLTTREAVRVAHAIEDRIDFLREWDDAPDSWAAEITASLENVRQRIEAFFEPTVNVPQPFDGSDIERVDNFASHRFGPPEGRCWDCDVRPGSVSSYYPCGTEAPRIDVPRSQANSALLSPIVGAEVGRMMTGEEE